MKKIAIVLAVALMAVSCKFVTYSGNGIGSKNSVRCTGPVETQVMEDLTDFNEIHLNGKADVKLVQADHFEVSVTANQEVFEYLDYKVEDGTLVLQQKEKVNLRAQVFDVTVSVPEVTRIVINGAADLDLPDGYYSENNLTMVVNGAGDFDMNLITVPELSFVVNGAGDIDAKQIDVQKLDIAISGAGDVTLSGKAVNANFSVSGAGDVDARSLECEHYTTHKSGVASIHLPK